MNDDTTTEVEGDEQKRLRRIKRAGQNGILAFVVLVIVLLAFGKSPVDKMDGPQGYRLNFNFISCLGILVGVFTTIDMLTHLRAMWQLSKVKKTLGLIGVAGLAAHTVIALCCPLSGGNRTGTLVGWEGFSPIMLSGEREWVIDDQPYHIQSTYFVHLPEGWPFTIECPVERVPTDAQDAYRIPFPLIKYAYINDLYSKLHKVGAGNLAVDRIGVVLFTKNKRTAKFYMTVDQVKKRVDESKPHVTTSGVGGAT
jgi:hypothetical protein